MKPRDISRAEYVKRMEAHGFRKNGGIMGYWEFPCPCKISCSDWNANTDRNRAKLAYMLRELDKHNARQHQPQKTERAQC